MVVDLVGGWVSSELMILFGDGGMLVLFGLMSGEFM